MITNWEIVPYQDSDHRAAVIDLWHRVFGYRTSHNAPGLAIDRKQAVADDLLFVAMLDSGEVAGTIMAGYDGHRGWLYSLAVLPSHRSLGIGSGLVRHAEAALERLGCMKINLQILGTNHEVESFYKKLGYRTEPRISMGKLIPGNIAE